MITSFTYNQHTTIVGGSAVGLRVGEYVDMFGTRPLVVTGGAGSSSCGAVDHVLDAAASHGYEVATLEGVPSNPGVAVVEAGVELARSHGADVIIGVGGGSVIDVAKAIAVGHATGLPIRSLLSGIRTSSTFIDAATPVIAVPTLPGSGSECNGTSVLIDEASWRKLSLHSDLAAPRVAILDPSYAATAAPDVLASSLADALCHAVESGLSTQSSVASDALARAAMVMIVDHASAALGEDDADEDRETALLQCLVAAGLAGQALTLAGSIATHPISHPVSAKLGAHHGAAVAALEPTVIIKLAARWEGRAGKLARWLGARVATDASPVVQAKALASRLASFNRRHGVTRTLQDMGLIDGMIEELADDVCASGSRGLANVGGRELTAVDVASIYRAALRAKPHVVPDTAQLL